MYDLSYEWIVMFQMLSQEIHHRLSSLIIFIMDNFLRALKVNDKRHECVTRDLKAN